jgi:hypothetical protein
MKIKNNKKIYTKMAFQFKNIEKLSEDEVFNLLLKYKVSKNTSIEFVKNYLSTIDESKERIQMTKIYKETDVVDIIEDLTENIDYVIRKKEVFKKDDMRQILKSCIELKMTKEEMFTKIKNVNVQEKNVNFITPIGVVKIMSEDKFKDIRNKELKNTFVKMSMVIAYTKEKMLPESERTVYIK